MENEISDIDELIGKVLAGEATAEEKARLETWTQLHPDNRKYVNEVAAIFEKASQIQLDFDPDAAWHKMKVRIGSEKRIQVSGKRFMIPWPVWRMAAGILLLMVTGIFLYRRLNTPIETFALKADAVTAQDTLPDGSTAFLNKKSFLTYAYNPREKTRKVKLSGEGFFEVKHEVEKPFVIEAEEVLIRDIGTAFNVRAWPDKDTVEVIVETGQVQIYTLQDSGINLLAGETGMYSRQSRKFSKAEKTDVNALAYRTGELSFVNEDLKSVIDKINKVYDSRIHLENPALGLCRLTVSFHHDTLETIVDVIAETMKLTVTRQGKNILLNGKGCN